jgi:hypothetical protein
VRALVVLQYHKPLPTWSWSQETTSPNAVFGRTANLDDTANQIIICRKDGLHTPSTSLSTVINTGN